MTKRRPEHDRAGDQADLVESLLDQLAYMREQLAEEREARRRADTIMAQLSQAKRGASTRYPGSRTTARRATRPGDGRGGAGGYGRLNRPGRPGDGHTASFMVA